MDVTEVVRKLQSSPTSMQEHLVLGLDYSPVAIFGGVMVALWLFIADRERHALNNLASLLDRLKAIHSHGGMFRYLPEGLPGLQGPQVDFSNGIVVRSIPQTGEMIGYVELLGTFRIGGVYAAPKELPSAFIEHIYVHDPFEVKDRSSEFSIDPALFEKVNWRTVGLGPVKQDSTKLDEAMRAAGDRLAVKYLARSAADDSSSGDE